MIREILTAPSAILQQSCHSVVTFDQSLLTLLTDMKETVLQHDGLGLAAPQIGVDLQVAVVVDDRNEQVIELVNPELILTRGSQVDLEGCLSLPNIYGLVKRHYQVTVRYRDRQGGIQLLSARGMLARIIQHELDHLAGKLLTETMIRRVTGTELEDYLGGEEDD